MIPDLLEKWLMDKLPTFLDRRRMLSERKLDNYPFVTIREAIINALIHRDYDIAGAKCQVVITRTHDNDQKSRRARPSNYNQADAGIQGTHFKSKSNATLRISANGTCRRKGFRLNKFKIHR